jgi:hypothetical protein
MIISRPLGDAGMRAPIAAPVRSAVIKRPPRVIVGPVGAQNERHDRDVDHVDIVRKINVSVPIIVLQILGRNPAAIAGKAYVAPRVASEAAMDVDMGAAGDPIDHWKSGAWARSHADGRSDNAPRRQSGGRHC